MTQTDKSGQADSAPELTESQLIAVNALVEGCTDGEAGQKAGVARQTVSRWKHHHPGFLAALNGKRQQLWGGSLDGARALVPLAVERLRKELTEDGPLAVKVALDVVKAAVPHLADIGPEDEKAVIQQAERLASQHCIEQVGLLLNDSESMTRRRATMLNAAGPWPKATSATSS